MSYIKKLTLHNLYDTYIYKKYFTTIEVKKVNYNILEVKQIGDANFVTFI